MKKYYVMKNKNDVNAGYTEVAPERIKDLSENRFFINMGDVVLESDEEHYKKHRKEYNHKVYLNRYKKEYSFIYSSVIEEKEYNGEYIAADSDDDFEERTINSILARKAVKCMSELDEDERELISLLYFDNKSEREVSALLGVSHTTVNRRKNLVLNKLRALI